MYCSIQIGTKHYRLRDWLTPYALKMQRQNKSPKGQLKKSFYFWYIKDLLFEFNDNYIIVNVNCQAIHQHQSYIL